MKLSHLKKSLLPIFLVALQSVYATENNSPQVTSDPITTVMSENLYNYTITAIDNDGDTINWNVVNKPDWLTFTNGITYSSKFGSIGTSDGEFSYPNAIALDNNGSIYITDRSNKRIQKFDSNGTFIAKFGSHGSGSSQFIMPSGIALDNDGNIYVVDLYNCQVQKFNSNHEHQLTFGSCGSANGEFGQEMGLLNAPVGIAIDSDGDIYVADIRNNRIQKFNSSGTYLDQFGANGTGDGEFAWPQGINIGSDGAIYVVDSQNHRVQKFDSNHNHLLTFGSNGTDDGEFNYPAGIALDSSDNIYITENSNHRIQKFDSEGNFISQYGTSGSADGELSVPSGIVLDGSDNIYITDTYNHRIQIFSQGTKLKGTPAFSDMGLHDLNLTLSDGVDTIAHNFQIHVLASVGYLTFETIDGLSSDEVGTLLDGLTSQMIGQLDSEIVAIIFDKASDEDLATLPLDVKNTLVFSLSEEDFTARKDRVADIHTNEERLYNLANLDLTIVDSLSTQRLEQVLDQVSGEELAEINATRLAGVIDTVSNNLSEMNSTIISKHVSKLPLATISDLNSSTVATLFDTMSDEDLAALPLDVKNTLVFSLSEEDFTARKDRVADIHTNEERLYNLSNLELAIVGILTKQRLEQVLEQVSGEELATIDSTRLAGVIDTVNEKLAQMSSDLLNKHVSKMSPLTIVQFNSDSAAILFDGLSDEQLRALSLPIKNTLVFSLSEEDFTARKDRVADIHTNEERLYNLSNLSLEQVGALSTQRLEQVLTELSGEELATIDTLRLAQVINTVNEQLSQMEDALLIKHLSKLPTEIQGHLSSDSIKILYEDTNYQNDSADDSNAQEEQQLRLKSLIPDQLIDVNNTSEFQVNISNYFENANMYGFNELKVDNNISQWLSLHGTTGVLSVKDGFDNNRSLLTPGKYYIEVVGYDSEHNSVNGYFTLRVKDINSSLSGYIDTDENTTTGVDDQNRTYAELNTTKSGKAINAKVFDDGSATHLIEGIARATSMLPDSTVKIETNGDLNTTTSTINNDGQIVDIEVIAKVNDIIKATHKLSLEDGNSTQAISNIENSITIIKEDRSVETNASIDGNTLQAKANPDGTAEHTFSIGGAISKAISKIKGAITTLSSSGIETKVTYADKQYQVDTDTEGRSVPKIDGKEVVDTTDGDKLYPGSIVSIQEDGTIEINTTIPSNGILKIGEN